MGSTRKEALYVPMVLPAVGSMDHSLPNHSKNPVVDRDIPYAYKSYAYDMYPRGFAAAREDGCIWTLSDTMYSLISFRKPIPPQNRQLNVLISSKLTIVWGS